MMGEKKVDEDLIAFQVFADQKPDLVLQGRDLSFPVATTYTCSPLFIGNLGGASHPKWGSRTGMDGIL